VAYLAAANLFSKSHLDLKENQELLHKAEFFYCSVSFSVIPFCFVILWGWMEAVGQNCVDSWAYFVKTLPFSAYD